MKIKTLFDYFPMTVMVSVNGSPIYSADSKILEPYLEYDIKSICPLHRGRTAYMGIITKQDDDLSDLKLNFLGG